MEILKEKDQKKVKDIFKDIDNAVRIVMFTQEMECTHCEMTRTMLEEVSGLSDKISLEVHDFVAEKDLAKKYGVDKIPATVLVGDKDYGIRFLNEFQDSLLFGTDVCFGGAEGRSQHLSYLRQLLAEAKITQGAFDKIASQDALLILKRYTG